MLHPPAHNSVTVRMDDDLLKAIDDYRFDNRIHKRVDAIRRLIEAGLELSRITSRAK
jgi:metal-responsive CopG/Arc/MetJ family transcriptional regulator